MKLPKVLKDRLWVKKYLEYLDSLNDEDLFDAVFDAQVPDDYDGGWSTRGWWEKELSKEYLRERFLIGRKGLGEKIKSLFPKRSFK